MATASSITPSTEAAPVSDDPRAERWLVLDSGDRLRVTVWPLEIPSRTRAATSPVRPWRFLVFEPEGQGERGFVRITTGVALERLRPDEIWALYKRARPLTAPTADG